MVSPATWAVAVQGSAMTMSIKASVKAYEAWLRDALGGELVEADLDEKHDKMGKGPFPFLRATYWRWVETIEETCADLLTAPPVLAIGDTHVENFGCWRDAEGRLVWGANDFDDAAVMPYPLDLVRLAASALLARGDKGGDSAPEAGAICEAVLDGYEQGLAAPNPFILDRHHPWLREAVGFPEADREAFWSKFDKPDRPAIGSRYRQCLEAAMPAGSAGVAVFPRQAGVGSLGRPRFVGRAEWRGGPVLREAKAVVQSAWVRGRGGDPVIRIGEVAEGPFRAVDPHYRVADGVVVRRLSPNSRKIEAKDSIDVLLDPRMLRAMGGEIANCHRGDQRRAPALREHLAGLPAGWLRDRAKAAARQVEMDHKAFS